MGVYRKDPRARPTNASSQQAAGAKKRGRPQVDQAPSRQVTVQSPKNGRRKPRDDPLALLQAQRAQRRLDENPARVDKRGKPSFIPLRRQFAVRRDLAPGAKICLSYLLNTQSAREKGIAYPYHETVARALGIGKKQIQRYLKELEDHLLLTRKKRGFGKSSIYYLHDSWSVEGSDDLIQPWHLILANGTKVSTHRRHKSPLKKDTSARAERTPMTRSRGHQRPEQYRRSS